MPQKELLNYIVARDYQAVENALQNGFDANTLLDNHTVGIQWASYTDDFRMIEIFWKHGANPTTEYIEEIVAEFENGKTFLDLVKTVENPGDYPDLTTDFSVTKWQFEQGEFSKYQANLYTVYLPVFKFVLAGEIVSTSIDLDAIVLPERIESYIGKTVSFPLNPHDGYIDGSVYLQNAHNPVDVPEIKFIKLENDSIELELTMKFDFEYEGIGFKNEMIKSIVRLTVKADI